MTTWISHLRIAANLLTRIPDLDAAQFAFGNLGPDSGIPDEKWEHFDPPKQITHFLQAGGHSESDIHDLAFYRQHLLGLSSQDDKGRFSYRLGYFVHLLVDILWARDVWQSTRERFARELQKDKARMVEEIKGDWYGLDFIYLRDHPDFQLWQVFLASQPDSLDLDFLPRHAVNHQLAHIRHYYQNQPETHPDAYTRPYLYLSKPEVDRFVLGASDQIEQVYHLLWPVAPRLDGQTSALQLLENNLDPDHSHR